MDSLELDAPHAILSRLRLFADDKTFVVMHFVARCFRTKHSPEIITDAALLDDQQMTNNVVVSTLKGHHESASDAPAFPQGAIIEELRIFTSANFNPARVLASIFVDRLVVSLVPPREFTDCSMKWRRYEHVLRKVRPRSITLHFQDVQNFEFSFVQFCLELRMTHMFLIFAHPGWLDAFCAWAEVSQRSFESLIISVSYEQTVTELLAILHRLTFHVSAALISVGVNEAGLNNTPRVWSTGAKFTHRNVLHFAAFKSFPKTQSDWL